MVRVHEDLNIRNVGKKKTGRTSMNTLVRLIALLPYDFQREDETPTKSQ
jgi:hypothetical protein